MEKFKKYASTTAFIIASLVVGLFAGMGILAVGKSVAPSLSDSFATLSEGTSKLRQELFNKGGIASTAAVASATTKDSSPTKIVLGNITDEEWQAPAEGKVIRVNLETMKMYLYDDAQLVDTLTIVGKGKTGSYWETPGGEYKVETKEENHFSSTGKVWMPYSMEFFGNYFIHGWPYYPGGREVEPGFSGGCIRLATPDAEKVFKWSDYQTRISIYSDSDVLPEEMNATSDYFIKDKNHLPAVSAESYVVGDLDTGDIILEKNKDMARPIASLTKLMTALVELDIVNQQRESTVSAKALATEGENGEFTLGEKVKNSELIYPLLMESSNDAAEILAEYQGRNFFVSKMNEKAKSIGLTMTSYEDPTGLSEENASSALDLFELASYIGKYKSFIFNLSTKPDHSYRGHTWTNHNPFVKTEGYMGGKTGYTDQAGETLVALFSLPLSEFQNRTIAIILLKSTDRARDARILIDYLKKNVSYGIHEPFEIVHQ